MTWLMRRWQRGLFLGFIFGTWVPDHASLWQAVVWSLPAIGVLIASERHDWKRAADSNETDAG